MQWFRTLTQHQFKQHTIGQDMNASELLALNGAIYCKDVIPIDIAQFLTHILMRKNVVDAHTGDDQVINALAVSSHEIFMDTVHEKIWPMLENIVDQPLLPTYSYGRLYTNENELTKHRDRPACEISVTVQLGRSHNYAWPLYAGNERFDLAEGDGVIYYGCDIEHWRNKCDGPQGYYSGQAFFHYVKANGKHADQANDSTVRPKFPSTGYVKHRAYQMETK